MSASAADWIFFRTVLGLAQGRCAVYRGWGRFDEANRWNALREAERPEDIQHDCQTYNPNHAVDL